MDDLSLYQAERVGRLISLYIKGADNNTLTNGSGFGSINPPVLGGGFGAESTKYFTLFLFYRQNLSLPQRAVTGDSTVSRVAFLRGREGAKKRRRGAAIFPW